MTQSKHTPTPWNVFYNGMQNGEGGQVYIGIDNPNACAYDSPCSKQIAWPCAYLPKEEREANAAFIVKAVNCHDELVECLDRLCETLTQDNHITTELEFAEKILAKAKGDA